MPYDELLKLCDWHKCLEKPIKGGVVWVKFTKIIFTSPERPENEISFYDKENQMKRMRDDIG